MMNRLLELPTSNTIERSREIAWLLLLIAGAFEVAFAVGLKSAEGFTKPRPAVLTLFAMVGSLVMLSLALRNLPLGVAYAVWTGLGTLGAVVFGVVMFGETMSSLRLLCLFLIILGVLGLHTTAN
jgi:quaternary ammonium compound-resistance protein SugE